MLSVLLHETTAWQLVGGLSLKDALAFLPACRASKLGAKKFSEAIAFALTRPVMRTETDDDDDELDGGLVVTRTPKDCCSVERWADLWKKCAKSFEAYGLDSGAWFYASTKISLKKVRPFRKRNTKMSYFHEGIDIRRSKFEGYLMTRDVIAVTEGRVDKLFGMMQGMMPDIGSSAKVLAVLYAERVSANHGNGDPGVHHAHDVDNVLVALTDGNFGWMVSEHSIESPLHDFFYTNWHADLFVAKDLPQVLVNADVSWKIREGRLHGDRGARATKWTFGCDQSKPLLGDVVCHHMASQQIDRAGCVLAFAVDSKPTWHGKVVASSILQDPAELRELPPFCVQGDDTRRHVVHSQVTEEVTHHDPAAYVDPDVASSQIRAEEDEVFAQLVENHARAPMVPHAALPAVNILTYRSGKGELFRKMLLEDKEFKNMREQLGSRGLRPDLKCGALVLVRPEHYHAVLYNVAGRELKRYNLIIAESDEYLLDEVLLRLSSKQRPRENRQERQKLDFMATFVTKRTFLCSLATLNDAHTVAQSTTEVQRSSGASSSNYYAHCRGGNPRRCHAW